MKANIGSLDKGVRISVSILISILLLTGILLHTIAFIGLFVIAFLLITSSMGHCPIYKTLGINTKKNLNDKAYSSNQNHFY